MSFNSAGCKSSSHQAGFVEESEPKFTGRSALGKLRADDQPLMSPTAKGRNDVIGNAAFNANRIAYVPYYPNIVRSTNNSNSPMNTNDRFGNSQAGSASLDGIFDPACFEDILMKLLRQHLRVEPDECQILITNELQFPDILREKIVEILLTRLSVHSCFVASPLSLTAWAFHNKYAVCVLDCGLHYSRSQVIFETFPMHATLMQSKVGGKALDDYLARNHALANHQSRQSEKGSHFFSIADATTMNIYALMKESLCEIVLNYEDLERVLNNPNHQHDGNTSHEESGAPSDHQPVESEESIDHQPHDDNSDDSATSNSGGRTRFGVLTRQYSNQSLFQLPDGSTVDIGRDKYDCGEGLFQPALIDMPNELSVVDCLLSSIRIAAMDDSALEEILLQNIVVTGGTSMMKGFLPRLERELQQRVGPDAKIILHTIGDDRRLCAWKGGVCYASNGIDWITRADHAEYGNDAVHQRCLL